jgi:hypothetical protein
MRPLFHNSTFFFTLVGDFYALINKHHRSDTLETFLVHRADVGACARFATYNERFPPLDPPSCPHPPHEGLRRAKVCFRPVCA